MSNFEKYQSLSRFGTSETDGILDGLCHVFYKIDGTNGSVWVDDKLNICTGSRNRKLTLENDNAGFHKAMMEDKDIQSLLSHKQNWRLYGEWLVPHSLKTYRKDAWRKFYVFDIVDETTGKYIPYGEYVDTLNQFGINYIPPIALIHNPTVDDLYKMLEKSGQFLVEDGKGNGEGIVIKNYDYTNKFGKQIWAKIITNEFKERHNKEMGAPIVSGSKLIEDTIVFDMLTKEFILKELNKILLREEWTPRLIPKVLGIVKHVFIVEEIGEIVKRYKQPTINFKTLNGMIDRRVKEVLKEERYM